MLTETSAEVVTDSDAERSSGSVPVRAGTWGVIGSFLARRTLLLAQADGEPAISTDELAEFARPNAQYVEALEFIDKVRPSGVDLDQWLAWMDGGTSPGSEPLDRPISADRTPSDMLDRKGKAVAKLERQIAARKRSIEELESQLVETRAANSAIIQFAFFERLLAITKSSLAVGPLWTFVRAIGAHDPDGVVDVAKMQRAEKLDYQMYAESRQLDTNEIFQCLDFMAGDKKFEEDLRNVILDLAVSRRSEIEERKKAGERVRPMAKIKTSMNGATTDEVTRVVSTLPGA